MPHAKKRWNMCKSLEDNGLGDNCGLKCIIGNAYSFVLLREQLYKAATETLQLHKATSRPSQ